jgi:hypothetical protein
VLALRVTDATPLLAWALPGDAVDAAEEAAAAAGVPRTNASDAAAQLALAAEAGISLPVCLAEAALRRAGGYRT